MKLTYSVKELALFLNTSESLVRKLVRENKLPYFKVGRRILFLEDDILKYVRSNYAKGLFNLEEEKFDYESK